MQILPFHGPSIYRRSISTRSGFADCSDFQKKAARFLQETLKLIGHRDIVVNLSVPLPTRFLGHHQRHQDVERYRCGRCHRQDGGLSNCDVNNHTVCTDFNIQSPYSFANGIVTSRVTSSKKRFQGNISISSTFTFFVAGKSQCDTE